MLLVYNLGHTVRPVTLKSCVLIAGVALFSIAIIAAFQILFGRKGTVSFILSAFCTVVTIHSFLFPVNEVYYRYPSLAAILAVEFLAVPFIIGRQEREKFQLSKGAAPENCFAVIALVIGLFICICTPVSSYNCWDDETHYTRTVFLSQGIYSSFTEADIRLIYSPDPVYDIETRINDINMYDGLEQSPGQVIIMSDSKAMFFDRIAYIGNVAFRWLGQVFGVSFSVKYILGRIGGLALYIAVMYLAIMNIKRGKILLSSIAVSPMLFFTACNYSQDAWVFALFSLGFSFLFNTFEENEKLSTKSLVCMLGAFVLASLPKMPYSVLLALLFLVPKDSFQNESQRKLFAVSVIVSFFTIVALVFLPSLFLEDVVGDTRGGENVNLIDQLKYVISSTSVFLETLKNFIKVYLAPKHIASNLSNLCNGNADIIGVIYSVLLTATAVLDGEIIPVKTRICGLALVFIQIIALASSMYLIFTPVGAANISGFQSRYLLPVLFPTLALAAGGWVKFRIKSSAVLIAPAVLTLAAYVQTIIIPSFV